MTQPLQAPWPWFGGKSRAAGLIWDAFGDVRNYVEPFAGSLAVLLGRPMPFEGPETVNDKDGFVANFWRAIQADPDAVADAADWPVNENDLHARHSWLVAQRPGLTERLEGDPDFYDAKIAGWWAWGLCSWIGSGWCSGTGPWMVVDRKLIHVGDAGRGVNRQLIHVGDAGQGVNRQLIHVGNAGQGAWFAALSERLRRVRVCSGDWSRAATPAVTTRHGLTGILLDPPYSDLADRTDNLYAHDSNDVAHDVREWAIANGDDPLLRIALCGYEGEHEMPEGWRVVEWKTAGGYGSQGSGRGVDNRMRERIWFSRHCRIGQQPSLFESEATA